MLGRVAERVHQPDARTSLPPSEKVEWQVEDADRRHAIALSSAAQSPAPAAGRSPPSASGSSSVGAWPTLGTVTASQAGQLGRHLRADVAALRGRDSSPRTSSDGMPASAANAGHRSSARLAAAAA